MTAVATFTATILKFKDKGEKSGWTYIEIPAAIAGKLKPGNKKTFRVKGQLDDYRFDGIALLPMGNGNFIMALNGTVRKKIRKVHGARLRVQLEADDKPVTPPFEMIECLDEEPAELTFFKQLPKSHQNYFIKWIEAAKTEPTKTRRIAHAVTALSRKIGFGEMLRMLQKNRKEKM